ncbi:hypothetical protein Bca4012_087234 [Brassica carinata]|uniref:Uncharacterized protein n=1 Tax=Brassica carinata TaxID=52824 RepID=A0A8X7TP91_BRACI|nr:hypothetical protein Bca52824_089078 [Brassica carinata]
MIEEDTKQKRRSIPESEQQLVEKPIIGDVKKANGKVVVDMEKTQKKIKQISEQKDSENQARGSLSKRESHDFKGNSPYKINEVKEGSKKVIIPRLNNQNKLHAAKANISVSSVNVVKGIGPGNKKIPNKDRGITRIKLLD